MEQVIITNSTSVAEEWEMICPDCNRDDEIRIKATTVVSLHHNGTEPTDSDTEWDNSSITFCNHCGFTGTVKDFSEAFDKLHSVDA